MAGLGGACPHERLADESLARRVFVDESGFNIRMTRWRGTSPTRRRSGTMAALPPGSLAGYLPAVDLGVESLEQAIKPRIVTVPMRVRTAEHRVALAELPLAPQVRQFGTPARPSAWRLPPGLLVACRWLVGGYPVGDHFGLQSVPAWHSFPLAVCPCATPQNPCDCRPRLSRTSFYATKLMEMV